MMYVSYDVCTGSAVCAENHTDPTQVTIMSAGDQFFMLLGWEGGGEGASEGGVGVDAGCQGAP